MLRLSPPNLPYINYQQPYYLFMYQHQSTWRQAVAAVLKIRDQIPLSWRSLLFSNILLRMPIYSVIRTYSILFTNISTLGCHLEHRWSFITVQGKPTMTCSPVQQSISKCPGFAQSIAFYKFVKLSIRIFCWPDFFQTHVGCSLQNRAW